MLSLCVVLAGIALVPLGLRAVNAGLPGAEIRASYVPTYEAPRPRQPFDEGTRRGAPGGAARVRGDRRFDGRRSRQPRTPVPASSARASPGCSRPAARSRTGISSSRTSWSRTTSSNVRGVMFFFRDDQLTTQVVDQPVAARSRRPRRRADARSDIRRLSNGTHRGGASTGARRLRVRPHARLAGAAADAGAASPGGRSRRVARHHQHRRVCARQAAPLRGVRPAAVRRVDAGFRCPGRPLAVAGDHQARARARHQAGLRPRATSPDRERSAAAVRGADRVPGEAASSISPPTAPTTTTIAAMSHSRCRCMRMAIT